MYIKDIGVLMREKKALALFSGGLDSLIAVKWMEKLGFEVIPIFFETPFFSPEKAIRVANANNLKLKIIDISQEHLQMLKAPRYGYGKHYNPCIDCHGLMFKILNRYLEEFKADFLISGEVLNQRPMSQRYDALNAVKKLSTVGDLIIRPLSQKRLPDTLPIREAWVNKEDLLDIQGRSRTQQLKIAEELNLKEVLNSGGGCLLTDKGFTTRLKELIDKDQLDFDNIKYLKIGRHFRLNEKHKLVINRHHSEMEYIKNIISNEVVLKCLNIPGPIAVLNTTLPISEEIISLAGSILLRYCPKAQDIEIVNYGKQFNLDFTIKCNRFTDTEIDPYRIN